MRVDEELKYPSHEAMRDWLERNKPAQHQSDVLQLPLPIPELRERPPAVAPAPKEPVVIDIA